MSTNDWKYGDIVVRADVAAAAKRTGPLKAPEPKVSYPPTPPEPPSIEATAVKILQELEQLRESAKEQQK